MSKNGAVRDGKDAIFARSRTYAHSRRFEIRYESKMMDGVLSRVWNYQCAITGSSVHILVYWDDPSVHNFAMGNRRFAPDTTVPMSKECARLYNKGTLTITNDTRAAIRETLRSMQTDFYRHQRYYLPDSTPIQEIIPSGIGLDGFSHADQIIPVDLSRSKPTRRGSESVPGAEILVLNKICERTRFMRFRRTTLKIIGRPYIPILATETFGVYAVCTNRGTGSVTSDLYTPLIVVLIGSVYNPRIAWGIVHNQSHVYIAKLQPSTLKIVHFCNAVPVDQNLDLMQLVDLLLTASGVTSTIPPDSNVRNVLNDWLHEVPEHAVPYAPEGVQDGGSTVDGEQ